jgi:preprotein translocase subunit SecD
MAWLDRRLRLTLLGALVALTLLGLATGCGSGRAQRVSTASGDPFVVFKALSQRGQPVDRKDFDDTVAIIRNRVKKLRVKAIVQVQGRDRIAIQLLGVSHKNAVPLFELIAKTAQLELFDLEADLTGPSISAQGIPTASTSLYDLLATQQAQAKNGTPTGWYVFDDKKRLVAAAHTRTTAIKAAKAATPGQTSTKRSTDLSKYKLFAAPAGVVVVTCGTSAVVCPGVNESPPTRTYYFLMKYKPNDKTRPSPEMTGDDLKLSGTRLDIDPTTSQPEVLLAFTDQGRRRFHKITKAEAARGRVVYTEFGQGQDPNNFNQHFAIVLDRDIKSFPSIDFREFPGGIDPINGARITGIRSPGEAKDLSLVLQTGTLPAAVLVPVKTNL